MNNTLDLSQAPWNSAASADLHPGWDEFEDGPRLLEAARAILSQGEALLRKVSQPKYTRRVPLAFNASIGGHYRHCLDHFTSLLRGMNSAEVDYDHRQRDPRIESEPDFALAVTRQLRIRIAQLPAG